MRPVPVPVPVPVLVPVLVLVSVSVTVLGSGPGSGLSPVLGVWEVDITMDILGASLVSWVDVVVEETRRGSRGRRGRREDISHTKSQAAGLSMDVMCYSM